MNVFVQGVDGAAGAMVGQNIGAKKLKRVSQVLWCALAVTLCFAILVMAAFILFPTQLYSLFTNDTEVMEFGRTYLRILAIGMPVIAISSCFKSISTGSGAALLSLFIGVSDGISRILVCLLAYHVFNQGVESYFWGAAFCMLIPGIASMIYFFSGKWKTKKLLSET
jgi:Na+-driven multidrug efflux pump